MKITQWALKNFSSYCKNTLSFTSLLTGGRPFDLLKWRVGDSEKRYPTTILVLKQYTCTYLFTQPLPFESEYSTPNRTKIFTTSDIWNLKTKRVSSYLNLLRPFSYSRYWSATSLRWRFVREEIDVITLEKFPALVSVASFSSIPTIQKLHKKIKVAYSTWCCL